MTQLAFDVTTFHVLMSMQRGESTRQEADAYSELSNVDSIDNILSVKAVR